MSSTLIRLIKNPVKFYRVSVLPKVYAKNPLLKRRRALSGFQKQFISQLSKYKINWDSSKKKLILAQSVSDYEMCIKIACLSNKLAQQQDANIGLYSAEYFEKPTNRITKHFSSSKFKTNLDKIYLAFGGKVLYRNNDEWKNQTHINLLCEQIIGTIKTKEDVLNIHIENCKIGDLLYDTYLRYANKPEVELQDPFLKTLILQSLNIYFVTKEKIKTNNVSALVSSYTTYIYHGIAVRICLSQNIPVYTIGAYYSLVHNVTKEYPSHANNHFHFNKLFKTLDNKEEILKQYKSLFEKRFEGVIDSATSYMKQSAFSNELNKELEGVDWKNTIVILAHCFFDSPHIYRDLLFPDFYEWVSFTLNELSKQKELTILVKQHPNGLPQNDPLFAELKKKYNNPNIKFIDKKTSQLQIINSRPKAIVTAYGTAAAEFSYQGFPVLTIYDNPFTAYDFTYLANTKEEYKEMLSKVLTLGPKENKKDVIEYYYMQYSHYLKGRSVDYLMCAKYKGQTFSDEFLQDYLPNMNAEYFIKLNEAMQDGLDLCKWEEENS